MGTVTVVLFGLTANKYRKRDYICNVYKFAEDTIPSRKLCPMVVPLTCDVFLLWKANL